MFHGIEKSYADEMIKAVWLARQMLADTLLEEAVNPSKIGPKADTLGLDQKPENVIVASLRKYDPYCVVITEERGVANPFKDGHPKVEGARTFFVIDPFDRSNQAEEFFKAYLGQTKPRDKSKRKIIDVVRNRKWKRYWVREWQGPLNITGATSGITCVRRGLPIGSVIINHFAEEITLACPAGIYHAPLPSDLSEEIGLDYVQEMGKKIAFPQPTNFSIRRVMTFAGKPHRGYPDNLMMCKLFHNHELEQNIAYKLPGGPSRVLYLSSLNPQKEPIAVVLANGEKIGEWMHWMSFVRFAHRPDDESAPALRIFEVSQSKCNFIDGVQMMPSPDYSIFVPATPASQNLIISVDRLQQLSNPSKYRCTLIMFPASNKWALSMVEQYGYREIVLGE